MAHRGCFFFYFLLLLLYFTLFAYTYTRTHLYCSLSGARVIGCSGALKCFFSLFFLVQGVVCLSQMNGRCPSDYLTLKSLIFCHGNVFGALPIGSSATTRKLAIIFRGFRSDDFVCYIVAINNGHIFLVHVSHADVEVYWNQLAWGGGSFREHLVCPYGSFQFRFLFWMVYLI